MLTRDTDNTIFAQTDPKYYGDFSVNGNHDACRIVSRCIDRPYKAMVALAVQDGTDGVYLSKVKV